jgi:hypothetical protein
MRVRIGDSASISRRAIVATPLAFALRSRVAAGDATAQSGHIERESIATVVQHGGLTAPLTLGMARVVLRPGAASWAETPDGARMMVVESGVMAIAVRARARAPVLAEEFATLTSAPSPEDELLLPAGTTMTFGELGVLSVRNPGARSVVLLDVVVYHEMPRPLPRAFTTDDGVSFQLLASANAALAPAGDVAVTLERVRLGADAALPRSLSAGVALAYVEAGGLEIEVVAGETFAARAAASAPYAMPGSLQPIPRGEQRSLTAGGVIFFPNGSEASAHNSSTRYAELLLLTLREVA